MTDRPRILVVRPDYLRWNVAAGLAADHRVETADPTDPPPPADEAPAVAILVGTADEPTIELCQQLADRPGTALVVATLDDDPAAELAFLRAGADDVVPATITPDLLRARVEVQVRHRSLVLDRIADQLELGALHLEPSTMNAEINGRPLNLQPSVFKILYTLASNSGQVVSTRTLHRAAGHEPSSDQYGNAVRIAISRLRRALGNRPEVPAIETVRLVGYRLRPPAPPGVPLPGVIAGRR